MYNCVYFSLFVFVFLFTYIFAFYSQSSQSANDIKKCKTLFMCPPFCVKNRNGCYVCQCGESMVNQMKKMVNSMKNDYKPLFQMGSQMTLNGGKTFTESSMQYGGFPKMKTNSFGGMLMPDSNSFNSQPNGMGSQFTNKQYMIQNYLEPNFKEFYRPFKGIVPGQCASVDFSCSPDCWKTDVYTGCFKCNCKNNFTTTSLSSTEASTKVSPTEPSTTVSKPSLSSTVTELSSSQSTGTSTSRNAEKTPSQNVFVSTTPSATTKNDYTLTTTSSISEPTSDSKPLPVSDKTDTTKSTVMETTASKSTSTGATSQSSTPVTSTMETTETTFTTTASSRTTSATKAVTITTTRTTEMTSTDTTEVTSTDTTVPTNNNTTENSIETRTTEMTSTDTTVPVTTQSTICPPIAESCAEDCRMIDPLTFCYVCYCDTSTLTITTQMTTEITNKPTQHDQVTTITSAGDTMTSVGYTMTSVGDTICRALSLDCPGHCVTLDKNWCAICSCSTGTTKATTESTPLAPVPTVNDEKVKTQLENAKVCQALPSTCPDDCADFDRISFCPVCNCRRKEQPVEGKIEAQACKPISDDCSDSCLVLDESWCPVCSCSDTVQSTTDSNLSPTV